MAYEQVISVTPEIVESTISVESEINEELVQVKPEFVITSDPVLETLQVTPSLSAQDILPEDGVDGFDEVLVSAIPTGSARTPDTHINVNLKMDIDGKRVSVVAQGSESESITPVVTPGWVQSGTAGNVDASAFGEMELPLAKVQDKIILIEKPQTIVSAPGWVSEDVEIPGIDSWYVGSDVPQRSSSDLSVSGRTVTAPAGYYARDAFASVAQGTAGTPTASKGAVSNHGVDITPRVSNTTGYINGGTVKGTPVHVDASELVSGSQTVTQNGTVNVTNLAEVVVDVPLPEGEFEYVDTLYEDVIDLDDTTYSSWTASSTAGSILDSANKATFVADLDTYVYYLVWEVCTNFAYLEGATLKAMPITEVALLPQAIVRRGTTVANIQAHNNTNNACLSDTASMMMIYYNTSGVATYVANNTYGIYPSATAATFSSSTGKSPTVTVKSPSMNARCLSSYFATARKPEVDTENTKIHRRCRLYRMHADKFGRQWEFNQMVDYYNAKRTQ